MRLMFKVLYKVVASHLPESGVKIAGIPVGQWSRRFRRFTYQMWTGRKFDKTINIEKGVSIAQDTIIGKCSGIGKDSIISPRVTIGDNVMIGPYLICYTQNHEFSSLERPMIAQGFGEEKQLKFKMMFGLVLG